MHKRLRLRRPSHPTLVAYLALFVALGGTTYAATGGNFILGQSNSASSTTALSATGTTGPGLKVTNTNTGTGATALSLNVASGHRPFTVNSATKVTNLNADMLDGKDSTGFLANGVGTVGSTNLADGAVTPAKLGTIPAARATTSSNQTISNNTNAILSLDTETFDTAALHDPSVNNTRLTAPISGVYQISAGVAWEANNSGRRDLGVSVNGAPCCLAGSRVQAVADASLPTAQTVSDLLELAAGDFVEAGVAQDSGGDLNALTSNTFFAMTWVGPG